MKIGIQITNKSSIDDEPMFNVVVVDRINFIEQVKRNISKKYPLVVKKIKILNGTFLNTPFVNNEYWIA